jgi:hypothetical protein
VKFYDEHLKINKTILENQIGSSAETPAYRNSWFQGFHQMEGCRFSKQILKFHLT